LQRAPAHAFDLTKWRGPQRLRRQRSFGLWRIRRRPGNDGFLITLTNHSTISCILSGYLNLVDTEAAGPALHVSHESSMLYTDPGPHTIVVVSGASAYFGIGYAEAGGCAYGGAGFHAINIEFASDVLTLPIGAWRASSTAGVESICGGDVDETAVSLSSVQG
jgi:hypothetical protein